MADRLLHEAPHPYHNCSRTVFICFLEDVGIVAGEGVGRRPPEALLGGVDSGGTGEVKEVKEVGKASLFSLKKG